MYDSVGVNLCNTVRNGALHYVLQLMGRVWCYGERLRARYHNHLATLYMLTGCYFNHTPKYTNRILLVSEFMTKNH